MHEGLPPRPDFLPPGFGTVGHQDFVEIYAPDPAPFTPETPAWWVLAGALGVAAGWALWRALRRYRRNAYRRAALTELKALRASAAGEGRAGAVSGLPALLKRSALAAFEREQVAGLSGEAWWRFLDRTAPGVFNVETKATLTALVVRDPEDVPRSQDAALFDAVERWLRGHHA